MGHSRPNGFRHESGARPKAADFTMTRRAICRPTIFYLTPSHTDLWLIIRVSEQAGVVATELGKTNQPPRTGFDKHAVCRHGREVHIPDSRGFVP
jgi:hypothetical protein